MKKRQASGQTGSTEDTTVMDAEALEI